MAIAEISLEYIPIGRKFTFAGEIYMRIDARTINHCDIPYLKEYWSISHPGNMLEFVIRPNSTEIDEITGEKDYKAHAMYKDSVLKNVSFLDE